MKSSTNFHVHCNRIRGVKHMMTFRRESFKLSCSKVDPKILKPVWYKC